MGFEIQYVHLLDLQCLEAEKKMKSFSSMRSIRVAADRDATLKGRFQESTEKPIVQMKVFSRLERKGKMVIFVTKW